MYYYQYICETITDQSGFFNSTPGFVLVSGACVAATICTDKLAAACKQGNSTLITAW